MMILAVMPLTDGQKERMRRELAEHEIAFEREPGRELVEKADVIVGNLAPARLGEAKSLKLLQLNSAGSNPYLPVLRERPGLAVACATGAYGRALSEHMLAMLLSLIKKLDLYRDDQAKGLWGDRGPVRSLCDMSVLCVGMGDTGSHFASLVHALGARVSGVRRRAGGECPPGVERVYGTDELDGALPRFDVVALSLPETPATVNMLDRRRLSLMKEGSFLLNVGRGSAVDQDALLDMLRNGRIAGCGLDVSVPEPLPPQHPLWREPNALITPHVAGSYHLEYTRERIVDIAIENVRRLCEGRELISRVDADKGY